MVLTIVGMVYALLAVNAADPPRSMLPRSASLELDDVSWLHEPSEAALHAGRHRDLLWLSLTMALLAMALLALALLAMALLTTGVLIIVPPHHGSTYHGRHRVKYNHRRTEALTAENTAPIRIVVDYSSLYEETAPAYSACFTEGAWFARGLPDGGLLC